MGRKEWQRYDKREQALELVRSGRRLTAEEIAEIKQGYSGIGGLCRSDWSSGAFFTPQVVVRFVHELIGIHDSPGRVIEPSCGGGAFLEGIDAPRVVGIEPNRDSHSVAKACYPGAQFLNDNAEEVFPFDKPSRHEGQFEFCIGNPPFSLNINWAGEIAEGKMKKLPSEIVFMEIAYRAVAPGGKIAMIVPDSLLSTSRALPARTWLMDRCYVRAVVSLPTETFYHAGTSVKTSILYLEKFPEGITKESMDEDYKVFMCICEQIGWDSRGRATDKCDLPVLIAAYHDFVSTGDTRQEQDIEQPDQVQVQEPGIPPLIHPVAETPSNEEEERPKYAQLGLF